MTVENAEEKGRAMEVGASDGWSAAAYADAYSRAVREPDGSRFGEFAAYYTIGFENGVEMYQGGLNVDGTSRD
ncbi:hypothetical protein [Streptomyces sp. 5-10]|uniref:hypothetical protein n=1 Tax=Streptomyces sp. 5-10 TaxID=878925 RepID=UPI00168C07A4|nr:hypothetical protein [Streptomyces sp. 5-10]MBD3004587.1 hypothetical protein [Streptomyces sp. 5-10]